MEKEAKSPRSVSKKFLKISPVYSIKANRSNFNKINILERSTGLKIVADNKKSL